MKYITHARTLEELRAEFLSDLRRRIAALDSYIQIAARNAAEKTRLAAAQNELLAMMQYWEEVEIAGTRTRAKRKLLTAEDISGSVPLPHISSGSKQ